MGGQRRLGRARLTRGHALHTRHATIPFICPTLPHLRRPSRRWSSCPWSTPSSSSASTSRRPAECSSTARPVRPRRAPACPHAAAPPARFPATSVQTAQQRRCCNGAPLGPRPIRPPPGRIPAGTGKTLVARALAAHASRAGRRVSFFMRKVPGASWQSMQMRAAHAEQLPMHALTPACYHPPRPPRRPPAARPPRARPLRPGRAPTC